MNRIELSKLVKLAAAAALIGLSTAALAEDRGSDASRQERMDSALANYRNNGTAATDSNTKPGKFARAEAATKHGLHKAGTAVKHGAQRVGHAVNTGASKAAGALRHTGEKIQEKTARKP